MRSRYLSAVVLLSIASAACGSKDTGPSYASAADSATISTLAEGSSNLATNTLDEAFGNQGTTLDGFLPLSKGAGTESATDRARALAMRVMREVSLHGTSLDAAAIAPRSVATFSECTPTITGIDADSIPIDSDADGVPDDYRVNFGSACVSEDSAGTERFTYSGSIRIQDTGTGFFSYAFSLSNLKIKDENLSTGDFVAIAVNGTESATFAAALASHSADFSVTQEMKSGANDVSLTVQNTENSSFDPDGAGTLTLGAPLPAGAFDYTADFRVLGTHSGGEIPGNFRLSVSTPTALHFNPACGSEIDAGVFRGLLNGNANVGFTVTWTGCGTTTFDVFGNTEPTA